MPKIEIQIPEKLRSSVMHLLFGDTISTDNNAYEEQAKEWINENKIYTREQFWKAVKLGNTTELYYFGDHLKLKDNKEWTPLHWAACLGHKDLIITFLAESADIEAQSKDGDTPLHLAIKEGSIENVQILLEKKAKTEARDKWDRTPLHIAAIPGNNTSKSKKVVKLLLSHKANIEAKTKEGYTPLHIAAMHNHSAIVKLLWNKGANIEAQDNEGNTPLHLATKEGSVKVVKLLLKGKLGPGDYKFSINVNAENKHKRTPLHEAAMWGHSEIVELLIDQTFLGDDSYGCTPLHYSIMMGNVRRYYEEEIFLDERLKHLGGPIIEMEKLKVVKLFLNRGRRVDVDCRDKYGWTPLHLAAIESSEKIVKLLLDTGADPNTTDANNRTAAQLAKENKHDRLATFIWQYYHKIKSETKQTTASPESSSSKKTSDNNSHKGENEFDPQYVIRSDQQVLDEMLLKAAKEGQLKKLPPLLELEANGLVTDNLGLTALHWAALNGHTEVINLLTSKYPQLLTIQDHSSQTALHKAALTNRLEIVMFLVDHGADENQADQNKQTPFDIAPPETKQQIANKRLWKSAKEGNLPGIKEALNKGADINEKARDGETALHKAVYHRYDALVEFLVQQGADITAKNGDGTTPLEYAKTAQYKEIRIILANQLLISAVQQSDEKTILEALNQGADVCTAKNLEGATSLHIAAQQGKINIIKLLLEKGAEIAQTDAKEQIPLHHAVLGGVKEAIKFILKRHAQNQLTIDIKNKEGKTPIDLCSKDLSTYILQKFGAYKKEQKLFVKQTQQQPNPQQAEQVATRLSSSPHSAIVNFGSSDNNAAKSDEEKKSESDENYAMMGPKG